MTPDEHIDRTKGDVDILEHVMQGVRTETALAVGRSEIARPGRRHRGALSAAEVRVFEPEQDAQAGRRLRTRK